MIRFLLLLYPVRWRKEYGPEFEALLASHRLTPRVMVNVAAGATIQRLRYTPLWLLSGLALLAVVVMEMVLQAFRHPIPQMHWFVDGWVVLTGLCIAVGGGGRFLSGLRGAMGAFLICKLPPLVFIAAMPGARFTDADGNIQSLLDSVMWGAVGMIGSALILGLTGVAIGTGIRKLRTR